MDNGIFYIHYVQAYTFGLSYIKNGGSQYLIGVTEEFPLRNLTFPSQ